MTFFAVLNPKYLFSLLVFISLSLLCYLFKLVCMLWHKTKQHKEGVIMKKE